LKLVCFKNFPKKTPFAPEYEYIIYENFINNIDFNKIAEIVLSKEKSIIENYPSTTKISIDGYTGLGDDSLTSRYSNFNVFAWNESEIQKLKEKIYEHYILFLNSVKVPQSKVWIQCWANVLRKDQKINPHLHNVSPYCYLGGHVVVQCSDTSTLYINPINQINDPETYESKNEVGKITFFQNSIPHYTTMHTSDSERITIAFDLIVDEEVVSSDTKNLILFDN